MELAMLRQEIAARFDGVERRLDVMHEQITSLRESRAVRASSMQLGAWIADAARMLVAAVTGALLGWLLTHPSVI